MDTYVLMLLVSVEQEEAIADLFKQNQWTFSKTGSWFPIKDKEAGILQSSPLPLSSECPNKFNGYQSLMCRQSLPLVPITGLGSRQSYLTMNGFPWLSNSSQLSSCDHSTPSLSDCKIEQGEDCVKKNSQPKAPYQVAYAGVHTEQQSASMQTQTSKSVCRNVPFANEEPVRDDARLFMNQFCPGEFPGTVHESHPAQSTNKQIGNQVNTSVDSICLYTAGLVSRELSSAGAAVQTRGCLKHCERLSSDESQLRNESVPVIPDNEIKTEHGVQCSQYDSCVHTSDSIGGAGTTIEFQIKSNVCKTLLDLLCNELQIPGQEAQIAVDVLEPKVSEVIKAFTEYVGRHVENLVSYGTVDKQPEEHVGDIRSENMQGAGALQESNAVQRREYVVQHMSDQITDKVNSNINMGRKKNKNIFRRRKINLLKKAISSKNEKIYKVGKQTEKTGRTLENYDKDELTHKQRWSANRNIKMHSCHRKCLTEPADLDSENFSLLENGYFCGDCKFIFTKKCKLRLHKELKGGFCSPTCIYCDKDECKEIFQCSKCPKCFFTKDVLDKHTKRHLKHLFECRFCELKFYTATDLRFHTSSQHMEQTQQTFLCDLCGSKFAEKKVLNAHRRFVHTTQRPEECATCGCRFKTKSQLKNHLVVHKSASELDLSCEICGKMFVRVATLRDHVRRHKKDFSLFCSLCGKGFYRKYSLEEHMRSHTGLKPFECTFCNYKCSLSCNLTKHLKIHKKH